MHHSQRTAYSPKQHSPKTPWTVGPTDSHLQEAEQRTMQAGMISALNYAQYMMDKLPDFDLAELSSIGDVMNFSNSRSNKSLNLGIASPDEIT